MTSINKESTLKDVAMIVCKALSDEGIKAVLSGGAVVSIYSENRYMSLDLDFIAYGSGKEIEKVMKKLGFSKTPSRYYEHPHTDFFVEFPSPPLAIGNRPINTFEEIESDKGYLKLLTTTHCVMDRLAAFYHWNDRQSLEQAVLVARHHSINMAEVESWSLEEGMMEKFMIFKNCLKSQE